MKKYLIRNCEIANFDTMTTSTGEILVEGERIQKIAPKIDAPEGCEIIDVRRLPYTSGTVCPERTHG